MTKTKARILFVYIMLNKRQLAIFHSHDLNIDPYDFLPNTLALEMHFVENDFLLLKRLF